MQNFKASDTIEKKFENAAKGILDDIGVSLDDFEANGYDADPLGAVIYDNQRAPLSNAIIRNVFLDAFNEIFTSFTFAGSFETYIDIFEKIFGPSVVLTFTVPSAGRLQIEIEASEIEVFDFVVRRIVNNQYVFDNLVTQDSDQIQLRTVKGFETEEEVETMLFETVPQGVFTEITLTVA